ncbi:hypothetical protein ABIA43_001969 [Bradyrhizobium sp. USDA 328]
MLDKAPQGDGQFACKSNDANLATAHPHPAKPFVPPQRKFSVWLVTEPEPSQLDQCLPSKLGACFVDTSIATSVTAIVRAGREPNERRHVSSRFERTMIDLGNQHRGGRLSNSAKCREALNPDLRALI